MTGSGRRQTWRVSKAAVRGRGGLVAAQHADAARIGAEVLAGGGIGSQPRALDYHWITYTLQERFHRLISEAACMWRELLRTRY